MKRACAKKKKLYKAFILSRSAESEHKYKTYKNKLTSILRLTEKTYYSTLLEQQRTNVKGTWKILNKVINKKYNKPTYPEYFLKNNTRISKKEDIANGFNHFFTNVGANLAKSIPLPDKDVSIYDYLEGEVGHTMFLNPVDDQEIIRTVQNCKNKMSTDYNDINMLMVKKIITQIVRPFVHICNVTFQTGVFPDKMKIAKVVPLFKSGEKNVFTNYRPISLLPQFSKILEKLYYERMDTFLNKHDILIPS